MGSGYSGPISETSKEFDYVVVCVRAPNVMKVLHAPPNVIQRMESILREVNIVCAGKDTCNSTWKELGYQRLQFEKWQVFHPRTGSTSASTSGKLFMIRLLEEMYKMGYDPVVSADLARLRENASIFFKKVAPERPGRQVVCLATESSDKLVLLKADDQFREIVRTAIVDSYPNGIQRESTDQVNNIELQEIKLYGNPWFDWEGEDNVRCRQMMIKIMTRLGQYSYKLISGINLKGTTDSLFFFKDETYRIGEQDICMVSLNHKDKLRLVDCMDLKDVVLNTITNNGNEIQEHKEKYGVYAIKLRGYPWSCYGDEAIQSRRLISRIAETFLSQGWALTGGIDLSRQMNDKSSLVFSRIPVPFTTTFGCISLFENDIIRLLDMPEDVTQALLTTIKNNYAPEINAEGRQDEHCYEIKLNGRPWGISKDDNIHGRNLMVHLLACATSLDWQLVCSADVSAKYRRQKNAPDYPIDVHSWWFVYWPSGTQQL